MTYDSYRLIFIGGAAMAGLMLIVTVILLFALKIPAVIGDLTGMTAKKAIKNIRIQNEASGEKTYRSSKVNSERGKLTEKITPSGRLRRREVSSGGAMQTSKLSSQQSGQPAASAVPEETAVLQGDAGVGETAVLSEGDMYNTEWYDEPLPPPANETAVLFTPSPAVEDPAFGDTVVLDRQGENPFAQRTENSFRIEYEIRFVPAEDRLL